MKLAPHDTLFRVGMTTLWSVLWVLVTFGVTLLLVAALLFASMHDEGYAVVFLFFGGLMIGQRFFIGVACLIPLIILLTAMAATDGESGRKTRAILGGGWSALAIELGYRMVPPGDVEMLGCLLPIVAVAGCVGGWFADRPSLWPSAPQPGERLPAVPMAGLRPLTLVALGLVVVAFWVDILANPGPQIG